MKPFIIYDWAGNDKSPYYGTFETFDDAWAALYEEFDHLSDKDLEEQLGEFFVDQAPSRQSRYLDPKDPRQSKVKS